MGLLNELFGQCLHCSPDIGRMGQSYISPEAMRELCAYVSGKTQEKPSDNFKGKTYDAEFEEVKKDEWWFKEQPKALLK